MKNKPEMGRIFNPIITMNLVELKKSSILGDLMKDMEFERSEILRSWRREICDAWTISPFEWRNPNDLSDEFNDSNLYDLEEDHIAALEQTWAQWKELA